VAEVPAEVHIVDVGGSHELVTVEVMRRQGCFEQMGVDARKSYVTNGAEAVELLRTGRGDVAMQVGFGPALVAIEQGVPLRVVAASNLLTVHALYSRDPGIRRLQDLPNRTVGVGKLGALTHQLVCAALRKQGVDPATVHFVSIGNSVNIFRALLAGQVEAGFGESEVFEHQAEYGVHALAGGVLWEELPEFPNQASFATTAAIRDKRDALVRVLAAYLMLYRFLQHPDSWEVYAAAWVATRPDSNLAEARVQWSFYQRYHPFAADLQLPAAQLYYLQELNVYMKLQQQVLPYDVVTDMSLARDALRLLDDRRDR
jgi:ABC-type nitrate/sulfonate/bicarbonate transport system substrate-binding protein